MVNNIYKKILRSGFTLIELLVAVAITGIVSVVGVNLLFGTVLSRAKQKSIQVTSEDVRNFTNLVSESVKNANLIEFTGTSQIKTISYSPSKICRIFRLTGTSLEYAEDKSGACNPSVFNIMTDQKTKIDTSSFKFEKKSDAPLTVFMNISGKNYDSFGEHTFQYQTTVVSRISI